ncbi:MAG TPA: hypothetical protein V6C71_27105 [Coleofasciculaceae cyanobacterium]
MTDKNLFLEPPETILEIAEKSYDAVWAVVGSNSRVVKNWRELVLSCPENAIRCYQHLSQNPMQRKGAFFVRIFLQKSRRVEAEYFP